MLQIISLIGFLVLLEGLLSFDNALALAAMTRHLPDRDRLKALTFGIGGAFLFRVIAIFCITEIVSRPWLKGCGGAYLLWLFGAYFFKKSEGKDRAFFGGFWITVIMVEFTDMAFSLDSIMAAIGVSSERTVLIIGGILGIIFMRFAASIFIKLIDKFPRLEDSAFLLVGCVGAKILIEVMDKVSFEQNPAKGAFWTLMLLSLLYGFLPIRKQSAIGAR